MNSQVGFSTGCLYKVSNDHLERARMLLDAGVKAIELFLNRSEEVLSLNIEALKEVTRNLDHISLHAPTRIPFSYGDKVENEKQLITVLEEICDSVNVKTVVFHLDLFSNYAVVNSWKIPVAFENSDWRKKIGKTPEDIRSLLPEKDKPIVLDINHVFSNDDSMGLFEKFIEEFREQIVEFHVSGFDREELHVPLYSAGQKTLASVLPVISQHGAPIIVESTFERDRWKDDFRRELDFITEQTGS